MLCTHIEQAAEVICQDLGWTLGEFLSYIYDDQTQTQRIWSSGLQETKLLYAFTRKVMPARVLELGTGGQCSSAHIAAALNRNDKGTLVSVDKRIQPAGALVPTPHVLWVVADGVEYARYEQGPLDMVFEDGPHAEGFTEAILRAVLPRLNSGGLLLVHDIEHPMAGPLVQADCKEVLGRELPSVRVGDSECGLGWWQKP